MIFNTADASGTFPLTLSVPVGQRVRVIFANGTLLPVIESIKCFQCFAAFLFDCCLGFTKLEPAVVRLLPI